MPVRPRITLKPGKSYTYVGTEGTYSVIAGEMLEGDSVAAGGNLVYGAGAPSVGTGKDGDVYLDLTDFKVHTKGSGAWGSGSLFKGAAGTSGSAGAKGDTGTGGTKGDAGLRGKVTLEGSGAPGTGSNLATPTAALTDALTDASLTSGDLDLGDIYLDTTNHRFYKKTALGWATRGLTFVGPTGSKGDTGTTGTKGDTGTTGTKGDTGAGVSKFSCALTADTYISTDDTQSTSTTAGSAIASVTFPATLFLTDDMADAGSVVTRTTKTYRKNSTDTLAGSLTGSKFKINTTGRYKIEYNATFNVKASSASPNSVDLTAFIDYSTNDGSTYTSMVTQTVKMTTESTATAQTTLELSRTIFLPINTTMYFRAKRGISTVSTIVSVNAITQTEVGDDTFIVITKL